MRNFKLILFFVTSALFVSCDDAIDITQPSELPPDRVFETVSDMQLGLNGVYASIPGESQIYFTSLFTDEVALGVGNGGQGTDGELAFLLNSNSGDAASMWLENYVLINRANRLINGVENVVINVNEEDATQDETAWYNHILAQARALRAYGHFNLLTFFSEDIKDDSSLGVILADYAPDGDQLYVQTPRSTTGEIFAFIDSDLQYAEANLSDVNPEPGDAFGEEIVTPYFYVSESFIQAFRARMAAYRGDYATAKTYVDLLDAEYDITPRSQYKAIWTDGTVGTNEVIFKVDRSNPGGNVTGNFSQFWSSVNSTISGSPFFEVNRALFNLVNNPGDQPGAPKDIRREVIVDASAFAGGPANDAVLENYNDPSVNDYEYKTEDILPVGKYPGSESLNFLNDIKVFRMSEMVLIRAEYYASIGDYANVIAQINMIRSKRYTTGGNLPAGSITTAEQAWRAILTERRIELAFEGHRYVDLRRLGPLANVGVDRDPRDCEFNGFCTLDPTDYRFVMPIPRLETAANNAIQQNPGY